MDPPGIPLHGRRSSATSPSTRILLHNGDMILDAVTLQLDFDHRHSIQRDWAGKLSLSHSGHSESVQKGSCVVKVVGLFVISDQDNYEGILPHVLEVPNSHAVRQIFLHDVHQSPGAAPCIPSTGSSPCSYLGQSLVFQHDFFTCS